MAFGEKQALRMGLRGGVALALAAVPCAQAEAGPAAPALRGTLDVDARADAPCEPTAGEACFTLLGVVVDGVTAVRQSELAPIYASYLTREVNGADLARIAQRITDHYRERGYFLSRAYLRSHGDDGIAHIEVAEGRIAEIVIEGDGAAQVAPYLRRLEQQPIAVLAEMDRQLALASDVPGIVLRTRMEPDPDNPSWHRLRVEADLQPVNAYGSADNRGVERVGPIQAYGRLSHNSIVMPRDQLGVSIFTTPQNTREFTLAELSYGYAFANGGRLRAIASASRSHDGANPVTNDVGGESHSVSLNYEYPLLRGRSRGVWVALGAEVRHQENDWTGGGGYADELRVARVALRGFLDDAGRSSSVFVQASLGGGMLGASGHSSLRRSRADADAEFAKVELFATHYQDFGEHLGIYGALGAQWANEPLLQSEEFSAGGLPFGRAFSYGEISGERGVGGTLELRAGYDPNLDPVSFAQAYAFLDGAQVWDEGGGNHSIASYGAGFRVTFSDSIVAGIEMAHPVDGVPAEEGDDDWRHFFSLAASY